MAAPQKDVESVNADVLAVLEAHGRILAAHGEALSTIVQTLNTQGQAIQVLDAKTDRILKGLKAALGREYFPE